MYRSVQGHSGSVLECEIHISSHRDVKIEARTRQVGMFPGRGVTAKRLSNCYCLYRFISFGLHKATNISIVFDKYKLAGAKKG
jgi:hypothetical protein